MDYKKLPKENFPTFVEKLRSWGEVHGPKKRGRDTYYFDAIKDVKELDLGYVRTIIPPTKKYFINPKETLLKFSGSNVLSEYKSKPIVLLGVHACDINALKILDKAYLGDYVDPYYKERREKTIIIGTSCIPDEYCFCNSVNASYATGGFDLFLNELPDGYLVRIGSHRGQEIAWKLNHLFTGVSTEDLENMMRFEERRLKSFKRSINIHGMPDILDLAYDSKVWEYYSEECLGCGSCTLVCPTCRCYDVCDEWVRAYEGVRIRRYDSCFIRSHGLVAGGHNFRPTRLDRFRHRYYCKSYFDPTHGLNCVGCGRCDAFCPAKIKHVEVITEVMSDVYKE